MTKNFDFHDTISVIIPGACALCVVAFLRCDSWKNFSEIMAQLNVGSSVIFLGLSYIAGELLQGIGEGIVKALYRRVGGGEPLHWILPVGKKADGRPAHADKLLSEKTCEAVVHAIKTEYSGEIDKTQLGNLFPQIKVKVYADDIYRTECIKMITKANFYSAMTILCLGIFIYFIYRDVVALRAMMSVRGYSFHSLSNLPFLSMLFSQRSGQTLLSIIAVCICAKRYRFFNIVYNRILLSAFLAISNREKKKYYNL